METEKVKSFCPVENRKTEVFGSGEVSGNNVAAQMANEDTATQEGI